MLVAGLILLKTSFSSLTLKVIFLLKTSILEWAVDKNGRPRIKGTSSSLEARISLIMFEFSSCLLADSAINLVDSVHRTVYSKLLLKFSLLPFMDNPLYSVVPYIVRIRPEQRTLLIYFLYFSSEIVELGLDSSKPVRSFSTSGSRRCSIVLFLGVFSHFLDGYFNISGNFGRYGTL
ncbi:hypothetical protein Tco_1336714 [Tanacetum coccineum]